MGATWPISSLLVDRRRNRCGGLADHDHGRAQQASIELIALLENLQDTVGLDIRAFLHRHGLVMLGAEWLAVRVDGFQVVALEGVLKHLQGQLHAFAHRTNAFVVGAGQLDTALEAVEHGQQVAGELLEGELVRLFHILIGTTTNILQVGRYTQRLVLRGGELLFEQLHARGEVFGASAGSLISV